MKRFLVERLFPRPLIVALDDAGRRTCASVVVVNEVFGVTWIASYVSADRRRTWCLYAGPSEAAVRLAAERNGLPVSRVTEVHRQCACAMSCPGDAPDLVPDLIPDFTPRR